MGKRSKRVWCLKGMLLVAGMLMAFCFGSAVQAKTITDAPKTTAESAFVIDNLGIITKYNGTDEVVIIPQSIRGIKVKGLSGAFMNNTTVKQVIVPDNIMQLGDNTFNGCTGLWSLAVYVLKDPIESTEDEIPDWEINNYIYDGKEQKGYSIISKNADGNGNCAIIPATLTIIGKQAFGGKVGIGSFVVLEGNTKFAATEDGVGLLSSDKKNLYRFAPGYNCNGQYTLPEGLQTIGSYAFELVHIDGGIKFPASLTTISDYGFYNYGMVDNNFVFPDNAGLQTIGSYAFSNNRKMQIKFPKSVKVIGSYCFADNENVAIDISETQVEKLAAYTFYHCSALHQLTMPATLKYIEAYAFSGCNNLDTVNFLGNTLETLGTAAFKDCPTLHTIEIPDGVVNIENDTFSGCGNLATIILPDSVTTIGDNAFKDCRTIETLVIPPNVKYISNTSFEGANQTKIDTSKNAYSQKIIKGELPKKGKTVKSGKLVYKVTKSHATKGTVTVVKAKNKKQKTLSIPATVNINGYDFKVTSIASRAFKKNKKLTSIVIGQNVKTIGKEAFCNCSKLKKITVKSKVISKVNKNAFKGIHKKAKIKLPKMSSKKFKKYKKKFLKKGQAKTVKITK